MYCSNCGRENNSLDKFCAGCGAPLGQTTSSVVTEVSVNKNDDNQGNDVVINIVKWIFRIGGIILGICLLIVFGSIFFVYRTEDVNFSEVKAAKNQYVSYDDINVPTIYDVMEFYEMCYEPLISQNSTKITYNYNYCDSNFDSNVGDEYLDYLVSTYRFNELEANEDRRVVYNDSMKNGYRVEVASYYNKSLVTYSFIKIEINDSEDNSL